MGLTEKRVKESIEKSRSYSEAARKLKVSRQCLWIFCRRHGLSIYKNSKTIAQLTPADIKELKKRVGTIKGQKSGFYKDKMRKKSFQRFKGS